MNSVLGILLLLLIIIIAYVINWRFYQNQICDDYNVFRKKIYLDNNGTTEICDTALESYKNCSKLGNDSSDYAVGANNLINDNNLLINNWLQNNYKVIYTSGASESNATIIRSISEKFNVPHVVISSYEHKSLLDCAKNLEKNNKISLTLVYPDMYGFINTSDVIKCLRSDTKLVSIMHANNEIGCINDIESIANIVKHIDPNIIFHTDMVQTFGKFMIDTINVDAISVSYHKFYGPQGLGLLLLKNFDKLRDYPLIFGSQNFGYRGGTMNISAIGSGYSALTNALTNRDEKNNKLFGLKKYIVDYLVNNYNIGDYKNYVNKPDSYVVNNNEIVFIGNDNPLTGNMNPNTLLFSVVNGGPMSNHFCNIKLKRDLFDNDIIVSIGSACNSKNIEASHVLHAIKAPYIIRCGVIRISLGDNNTLNDVKIFCDKLSYCINKQR